MTSTDTTCNCLSGGASVILGNRARRVLLSGAKQVQSGSNNRRHFVKRGSYADALRDFYGAKPTDIKEWKEMNVKNVWVRDLIHVTRKPVFGVSDQVRHKPAFAATEDGERRKLSDLRSRWVVLSM